ncbi:hypothetical protein ANN_18205 [Periplaneta americana]|uniref:Uncharacterized protein n=1 Tax=Periplaneta americana TaxID=6978 RepID=A0ABQ8SP33_PERAM|nr:hypothetical protein ANN_18205 [Periplaneta americana]
MAGLCEGGNDSPGSLKASKMGPMAGLYEGGNEPPSSLKAIIFRNAVDLFMNFPTLVPKKTGYSSTGSMMPVVTQ